MSRILIENVTVIQTLPPFEVQEGRDVLIEDSRIVSTGPSGSHAEAERVIDGRGKYLIAGNVCSHHHYYSGLSRGMLIRLFRNHFGKSPSRFLLEIRLNQIRHLLDSTDLTLSEIARRCGYGSDMALSLAFRRENGIPPGEFRNSRRHMEP